MSRELKTVRIHVTGIGRKRARATLAKILSESNSPSIIIAAGFCGALQPSLKVGDVVIASEVIDEAGHVWPVTGNFQHEEKSAQNVQSIN